jgi:glucose-1-phosphate adenylyltransferase
MSSRHVFGIVLAGGEGKRLMPLTEDRAKPAVPFGGNYRLVDFALSNLVNAGYLRIAVLTQYKSHSLDRHVSTTWRMSSLLGNYVTPVPAQMRRGPHWFSGSADAIYQNLNLIYDEKPAYVVVLGADHIYRMDPRQVLDQHIASGAGVTVVGMRVPIQDASSCGVIDKAPDSDRITAFREKPTTVEGLPDAPHQILASMGNYVFTTEALIEAVTTDAKDADSRHDLGGSIIPLMTGRGDAYVYDFNNNEVPGLRRDPNGRYWRDVGTLDAYYDANMDLISVIPAFNLYNREWPILTMPEPLPPAKFVFSDEDRMGYATDSLVCAGVIVAGGHVHHSILSPGVQVHERAQVRDSVLMHDVIVNRDAIVRKAILDKGVVVEAGAAVGVDLDADRARFVVSEGGVVVIGKGQRVTA